MLRNQARPPLQAVAHDTAIGDSASGQPCIRYVASEALEVRSKPSEDEGAVIAMLPPAQRVKVIEPAIAGEWARINIAAGADTVGGFVLDTRLRELLPAPREALVQAAVAQWQRFDRGKGKWPNPPYDAYVDEMWDLTPVATPAVRRSGHWSAAFTSFIVHEAGSGYDGFTPSARHADYINAAFAGGGTSTNRPFVGHLLADYAPRPGDLIAQCREDFSSSCGERIGSPFKSLTGIVVASNGCYVTTIGGAENASVQMRHYAIDSGGLLKPSGSLFAVLENRAESPNGEPDAIVQ